MNGFKFDFSAGDFEVSDGKISKISGTELIKNKIEKLLRTEFEKYDIYSKYGMPYHNWVCGQRDRELVRIAMTRELAERIPELVDGVARVYDITFEFERGGVKIAFFVETEYMNQERVNLWIAL